MTSLEVVAVMAGVPLAIMVVLGLLTLRPHYTRAPRYRPGEEWNYRPVLFTANPEVLRAGQASHHATGGARGGARGHW
ncbi:MAG: aa3-type cytochrome oxidase subunit CtaJ [Pseudonocardiaceae bacterium]